MQKDSISEKKRASLLNNRKSEWSLKHRCIKDQLTEYTNQFKSVDKTRDNIYFPFPCFERLSSKHVLSRENTYVVDMNMHMDFHVLYAEMEILRLLIKST